MILDGIELDDVGEATAECTVDILQTLVGRYGEIARGVSRERTCAEVREAHGAGGGELRGGRGGADADVAVVIHIPVIATIPTDAQKLTASTWLISYFEFCRPLILERNDGLRTRPRGINHQARITARRNRKVLLRRRRADAYVAGARDA